MTTLDFAPMESLGSAVFRRLHARYFGGVDHYYIAFVTPTREPHFTARQLRELAPEVNAGLNAIPQLLTRRAEDFLWAAKTLSDMGYREVNLNLGCPAGTVVAKGKGAGFLRDPAELECFLQKIFDANLPIAISVKTRLGWSNPAEFEALAEIFNHFPISQLTLHARVKTDFYKGHARLDAFEEALKLLKMPVGFNGDIVTTSEIVAAKKRFPSVSQIMVGRGLVADPALFRKARGGAAATKEELRSFTEELFSNYSSLWGNPRNALMRMKEYWFLLSNLFDGDVTRDLKALFKARTEKDYATALDVLFSEPLRSEARFGWFKPLA